MARYRKLIASLVGAIIISLETAGVVFPDDSIEMVAPITAFLTALLVWAVPNAQPKGLS